MDPLSQAIVGALLPQALAKPEAIRKATILGIAGGMAADLDVLIRSTHDQLLQIEYHRHFSHSLIFIPVGGFIVGAAFWPFMKKRLAFSQVFKWATLGYATGGILDACTSYGTRLLWPFAQTRVSWDLISVIDPIFTFTTLTLAILAAKSRSSKFARWAWLFIFCYLSFGLLQQHRAKSIAMDLAHDRGDSIKRIVLKPSFGNVFLWRSIYETGDRHIQADGIRPGFFQDHRVYKGERCPLISVEEASKDLKPESRLKLDLERFAHFSDHWLGYHPTQKNVVADMRYSTMPDQINPLWGIEMDYDHPEEHAKWLTFREIDEAKTKRLWSMILARDLLR
ncbi:MAG: inner membrane protein [Planctomycetota bacterium]|jgi:inner membrane protein